VSIRLPDMKSSDLAAARRALETPARLELVAIDDEHPFMRAVAGRAGALPSGVTLEQRPYFDKVNGLEHKDVFLEGPSPAALRVAFARAGVTLPVERELVFEEQRLFQGPTRYRSYLIDGSARVDNDDLENAEPQTDAQTGQPVVALRFTLAGAKRFEALTRRCVGRKLAIILDGKVMSAPIVMEAIAGGMARMSLGGAPGDQELALTARALTEALRAGPYAAPLVLIDEGSASPP
jgi:preprotein translocase subunit SecD